MIHVMGLLTQQPGTLASWGPLCFSVVETSDGKYYSIIKTTNVQTDSKIVREKL